VASRKGVGTVNQLFVKLWDFNHPSRDVVLQFLVMRQFKDGEKNPHTIQVMTTNEFGTNGACELRYSTSEKQKDAFLNYFTDKVAEEFFLDLIAVTDKVTKKQSAENEEMP
jgi:hypothetical protein